MSHTRRTHTFVHTGIAALLRHFLREALSRSWAAEPRSRRPLSAAPGEKLPSRARPRRTLTVGIALLPDAVHPAVGVDAQEEAAVLAVEPLGVLEVPGGERSTVPVVGQRRDAPRRSRHAPGPGGTPAARDSAAASRRQPRAAPSPAAAVQPRLAAARPLRSFALPVPVPGATKSPVPSSPRELRNDAAGRREEG